MMATAEFTADLSGEGDAGGLKSLARSAKDEAEAQAIAQALGTNQLESQASCRHPADQLQGAALQDPAVWHRRGEGGHHKLSAGA